MSREEDLVEYLERGRLLVWPVGLYGSWGLRQSVSVPLAELRTDWWLLR
jgi:hypothetical protein